MDATSVGHDVAPNLAGSLSAKVERSLDVEFVKEFVEILEDDPAFDRYDVGLFVKLQNFVHFGEVQDDFVKNRYTTPD